MPPSVVKAGPFRRLFFSREEPCLPVHEAHPVGEAKFWLTPSVHTATAKGLSFRQLATRAFSAWMLAAGALMGAGGASAAAHEHEPPRCEGTAIAVVGASAADFQDVCHGVLAARTFLAGLGLDHEPVLTVEVAVQLPQVAGTTAVGCYVQEKNRAYVKSYAAFKLERSWLGVPVSRTLYRSVVAHETAHAVAACHFSAPNPSIQAKEYVAYVTLFATLPEPLRRQSLRAMPGTGFANIERVSSYVYLFAPMLFGANAYRHFLTLKDPVAFMADVLAGKVLTD